MKLLITGGAGFIGSALVRELMAHHDHEVVNVDCLSYAGNLESLGAAGQNPRHVFVQQDISDQTRLAQVFAEQQPDAVIHLAAESHVDRSLDAPAAFIQSNLLGSYSLLEVCRAYYAELSEARRRQFRLLLLSTDEVFGDLPIGAPPCDETRPYAPSSPYAASKAGADHLARAWARSYGLPLIIGHSCNNYGPYQFPEKLIPHMVLNALAGRALPVYGDGQQSRDWLHVDDHVQALLGLLAQGCPGESYAVSAACERTNLQLVTELCRLLDELAPERRPAGLASYAQLIRHVADRPGHDRRYALDASKLRRELGWQPRQDFSQGLRQTVQWYLDNPGWWQRVLSGDYRLQRLGQGQ